jgi:hypothetical protein
MAVVRVHPNKSNTIYSDKPYMNSGKDQIIELTSDKLAISRILLGFSVPEISSIINSLTVPWSAFLKLYIANESGLPENYIVQVKKIASEWKEGTGNALNEPETHSSSTWIFTDTESQTKWIDNISSGVTTSYNPDSPGGGNWYSSENADIEITKATDNYLYVEVSDLIETLVTGLGTGLLVKLHSNHEGNYNERINVKYFSEDTNTIYKPVLEIRYNDSEYTATDNIVNNLDINVSIARPYETVSLTDIINFKIGLNQTFKSKTYTTVYSPIRILNIPNGSYWQLRDVITGEIVIAGSPTTTKISCVNNVNFFTLNLRNLYKHRYYTFDIFIVVGSNIKRFTPKYTFNIDG